MTCQPGNQNAVVDAALVGGGTTSVTCAGFTAPSGSLITNLNLTFFGSFTETLNFVPHQLSFSGSSFIGNFGAFQTGSDTTQSNTGLQAAGSIALNTNSVSSFNVTVNTSTVGGQTLPDQGIYTVRAIYTYEVQQSGGDVPEPTTLALVGGVLILAGLRKFRK